MLQFLIIFILVILSAYVLERFLIILFGFKVFRLLAAPGIFVHEASHAILIMLFGGKIKSFKIFKFAGGEVTYTKPFFPIISQPLISMAPILGCSVALYYSGAFLGFDFNSLHFGHHFQNLLAIFQNFNFNWYSFLFLYLVFSLTSAMAPSKKDLANAAVGLILYLVIFIAINYFFPQANIIFNKMSFIYLVGLYLVIVALIISLLIWLMKSALIRIFFQQ